MDKIKLRQICFILAAVLPVGKMIVYPATIAYHAHNDLLFSALANFFAEGLVIALILLFAKNSDKTLFERLQNAVGPTLTKGIYLLFALFFAGATLLPLLELKGFVSQILYENTPSVLSFAPFFAVCLFACVKGFKSIGRVADIAMPVFAVCLTAILLLALPDADFSALLPIGGTGGRAVLRGSLCSIPWFTDSLFLLFFLGHFRYERHATGKVILAYAIGAAATLLFLALFYAIFADIAILQQNSLAQISKYTTAFTSLGRIDLLFVFALTLVSVFYLCIPVQMCVHCLHSVFGKNPLLPAVIVNAFLLTLTVLLNNSFRELQTLFTERLWFLFGLFAYLLPFLCLFLSQIGPRGESGGSPGRSRAKTVDSPASARGPSADSSEKTRRRQKSNAARTPQPRKHAPAKSGAQLASREENA